MADIVTRPILPLLEGETGKERIERFWSKVDRHGPDDCWLWNAGRNGNGYGSYKIASYRTVTASRVALILKDMTEYDLLHCLHSCDNPPCCNPAHLRWGTNTDNHREKIERGRARSGIQSGFRNPRAKLTPDALAKVAALLPYRNNVQIAREVGTHHSTISAIRVGKTWASEIARLNSEAGQ